jgi:hypothetical protein
MMHTKYFCTPKSATRLHAQFIHIPFFNGGSCWGTGFGEQISSQNFCSQKCLENTTPILSIKNAVHMIWRKLGKEINQNITTV